MRRILVMGSPGSGKSRFARLLGTKLSLPIIHLDAHYWQPGWVLPDRDAWRACVGNLAAGDGWIMDGNYSNTLDLRVERADGVIWLECPRRTCLRRVLWRSIRGFGKTRPDMQPDCRERIDPEFIRYVWNFQGKTRPEIERRLAESGLPVTRLRGKSEVAAYLAAA
jgi:adenylate kinase family enzyme